MKKSVLRNQYEAAMQDKLNSLDQNKEVSVYDEESFDGSKNEQEIEFAVKPMDGDYSEGLLKECLRSTIVVVPKKTKIVDLKEFVLQHLRAHPRM